MWSAVCAQEEAWARAGGCCQDCLTVLLTLQDRQAEGMRPQPSLPARDKSMAVSIKLYCLVALAQTKCASSMYAHGHIKYAEHRT